MKDYEIVENKIHYWLKIDLHPLRYWLCDFNVTGFSDVCPTSCQIWIYYYLTLRSAVKSRHRFVHPNNCTLLLLLSLLLCNYAP